jgi:hypothetical protein
MKRVRLDRLLPSMATLLLGLLGFSSCGTLRPKPSETKKPPVIPRRDSIARPPYGEAVLMYGTPYKQYETKEVPKETPLGPSRPEKKKGEDR